MRVTAKAALHDCMNNAITWWVLRITKFTKHWFLSTLWKVVVDNKKVLTR
jgi:hypothetical protein